MKKVITSFFLFIGLFAMVNSFAQSSPLALKVQAAKEQRASFDEVNLFKYSGDLSIMKSAKNALAAGQILDLEGETLKDLTKSKQETFTLVLPTTKRSTMKIDLVRHQTLADGFYVEASSGTIVDYTPGVHYRGIVRGDNNSLVAVSIFEDQVMAVVSTSDDGNMVLGKTNEKSDQYIFYKERDLLDEHNFECGTDAPGISDLNLKKMKDIANADGGTRSVSNCVKVYLECEHDMFKQHGSVAATSNYMTGLFNMVATLYQNEQITTQISQIFVWDTPDSYPTNSTISALTTFRSTRPNYNGDLAHLVSRGAPSSGGVAWVNALCSSYGYAYSWIANSYQNVPTYSWSVEVLTHEMGHNLGSPHTHACSWNGNNTAIDGCGPASGNSEGCNASVPNKGTIMSYCHLVSGVGIDFNLGFGPQPGDRIRNAISNAGCLSACGPPCNLTVAVNGTNANGGNNGSATATAANGTTPYGYSWSNGASSSTITGLAAGTYTVTVTDGAGCVVTKSVTVEDVTPCSGTEVTLSIVLDNYPSETTWDIVNSTGTVVANGGSYGGNSSGSTVTGTECLADGCYTFTIYDSYGDGICCAFGQGSYALTDAAGNILASGGQFAFSENTDFCFNTDDLAVAIVNSGNASCFGGNEGFAVAQASGGSGNYSYAWSNGSTNANIGLLTAGTYTVTVSDAGQTATASVIIGEPSAVNVSVTGTAATQGNNGTATASANGGTPGYSYQWNNGSNGATITNLAPGTYTVTVSDANNCRTTGSYTVQNNNAAFTVSITNSGNVSCNGENNGFATATAAGGSGSYSYTWSNGATTATITNIPAGAYTVTATDGSQSATAQVTITQPSAVNVSVTGSAATQGNNGTATASANGGTPGYSYQWNNGSNGATITNLAPGTYTVTVSDANNCRTTGSYTVQDETGGGGECTEVTLSDDDFENGWGIWNDGGVDCHRINNSTYALGNYSIRLRDDGNGADMYTDVLALADFEEVTVSFSYYAVSMDNGNEDFWLQRSSNGGSSWTTVEEWNRSDEFQNRRRYYDAVTMTGTFTNNTRFRFRCDASSNYDWVYIDQVQITGCTTGAGMPAGLVVDGNTSSEDIEHTSQLAVQTLDNNIMKVFPNPASTQLTVAFTTAEDAEVQFIITDFTGRNVRQWISAGGQSQERLDISSFEAGYYFIQMISGEERTTQKFVIIK